MGTTGTFGSLTVSERAALAAILASASQHSCEAEEPGTETETDDLAADLAADIAAGAAIMLDAELSIWRDRLAEARAARWDDGIRHCAGRIRTIKRQIAAQR